MRKVLLAAAIALLVSAAPASAANSDPVLAGYGDEAGQVQGDLGVTQTQTQTLDVLPFTGAELTLLVVGGIALVTAGVAVRRFARR